MSPYIGALAQINRRLAQAHREGDAERVHELAQAQAELRYLIRHEQEKAA